MEMMGCHDVGHQTFKKPDSLTVRGQRTSGFSDKVRLPGEPSFFGLQFYGFFFFFFFGYLINYANITVSKYFSLDTGILSSLFPSPSLAPPPPTHSLF